jgi:ATP/maltotriose-dependent transcriptional regulator MalT
VKLALLTVKQSVREYFKVKYPFRGHFTNMPDKDRILLNTKLHRPPLPHDLVERSRLVELLDTGIESPLTLVCAPAGFGKSTMVSTWLERMAARRGEDVPSLPFAWISLD